MGSKTDLHRGLRHRARRPNRAHLCVFRHPGLGGRRPTEIADEMQITKQSVNELIGHLERQGYLRRVIDPDNSRARIIQLTPEAAHLSAQCSLPHAMPNSHWRHAWTATICSIPNGPRQARPTEELILKVGRLCRHCRAGAPGCSGHGKLCRRTRRVPWGDLHPPPRGLPGHRCTFSSTGGSRSHRSGFSLLHSPPCGQCETETDKDCGDTADVSTRSSVVWEDQRGDNPKVEPHSSAGVPEDAPTGSAAGGEHSGDGQYRGVLGVIRPLVALSRRVRSASLTGQGDGGRHQQGDSGKRGEDEWGPRHPRATRMGMPGRPASTGKWQAARRPPRGWREEQTERQDDGGGDRGCR
jgi:DNA-binding MarR family transcriptional regulator